MKGFLGFGKDKSMKSHFCCKQRSGSLGVRPDVEGQGRASSQPKALVGSPGPQASSLGVCRIKDIDVCPRALMLVDTSA
jgi:hypothetical protein